MIGPCWLTLQETIERIRSNMKTDAEQARKQLVRAISTAALVRPGRMPLPVGPDTRLRVRIVTDRVSVGNDWLENPTLYDATSEIDCRSYMPGTHEEFERRRLHRVRIEIWAEDVERIWPAQGKHVRYAGDDALVKQGIKGIRAGKFPNKHQAAEHLADQAEGAGTRESKIARLERKIGEQLGSPT